MRAVLALTVAVLSFGTAAPRVALAQVGTRPALDTIVAGIMDDWPPHFFRSARGLPDGFAVDMMEAVAARTGLHVEYMFFSTFPEALDAVEDGRVDVIPDMGDIPQRSETLDFTAPFDAFPISVIVRSSSPGLTAPSDLAGRPVGVVRANAAVDLVAAQLPEARTVLLESVQIALLALLSARVDAVAFPEGVFMALARAADVAEDTRVLPGPLAEIPRAMAVREGNVALRDRLDRGLTELVTTPEYAEIYRKWFAVRDPYWTARRVAWAGAASLLAVLMGMAWWRYRSVSRLAGRLQRSLEEQRAARAALMEEEVRFGALVDAANEGVVLCDGDGVVTFVNPRASELLGQAAADVVGHSILDFIVPDDRLRVRHSLDGKPDEPRSTPPVRLTRPDGREVWVLLSSAHIGSGNGVFRGYVATLTDITDRVAAEQEVASAERMLRRTLASLDAAVFVVENPGRTIVACNPAASRMFGYDRLELIGRSTEFLHVDDAHAKEFLDRTSAVLSSHASFQGEFEMRRADGSVFPTRHVVSLLEPERGATAGVVSVVWDVTQEKEAELRLRDFYRHLQEARENERSDIAREIHDDLGQSLTALKVDLGGLLRRTPRPDDAVLARLREMDDLVDATIQTVRQIAKELRPGVLDELGLVAALEWMCEDFGKRADLECRFDSGLPSVPLERSRAIHVFRVAQEALTNVARHADASRVEMSLVESSAPGWITLSVLDDGVGIDVEEALANGTLGLTGMHERARILDADLSVHRRPEGGTCVRMELPLEPKPGRWPAS